MSDAGSPFPPEVLYAKHRLLPEIGAGGQDALCRSTFHHDPRDSAQALAADLLVRSGLSEAPDGAPLALPGPRRSSDPALDDARTALAAAMCATERVRTLVGAGTRPLEWPESLFPGENREETT